MDEVIASLIQDSVGWGITLLVLVGLYKLANRLIDVLDRYLERLNNTVERMTENAEEFVEAYKKNLSSKQ